MGGDRARPEIASGPDLDPVGSLRRQANDARLGADSKSRPQQRLLAAPDHDGEEPPPLQLLALLEHIASNKGWFWKTNATGITTFVSASFAAVSGMQPGEVLGRNEWGQDRQLTAVMARRMAAAARQRTDLNEIEFQQLRGPGLGPIWCITSGVPVWDEHGVFSGYWGVTRVITERKRVEQRLEASEARYRQLADTVSDWVWTTNEQHQISGLSIAQSRIAKTDTLGRCRWNIPDAQLPENDWAGHRATLDARLPFRDFEFARQEEGGARRWISISGAPRFDGAGVFLGYQGTGRYVTERKLAELAHARAQSFYAALGEVGEAALRARTAQELLVTTCRVLHKTGGLVGVSYYQADESNEQLDLVAGAGASTPATMRLGEDGADPARQRPSFQAWLTRTTVVANEYLQLESTRKFHDYYRAQGIESSMVTPVPGEGTNCHGLLALMAAVRDWFDADLVSLSERIAVVLGQALSRLALEQSKAAAEAELARSEVRYRQFAALASDWHWETDTDHRFTYMSGNLGVHRAQELGERVGQVICSPPCTPEPEQLARYRAMLDSHEPIRDVLLHITGLPMQPWWRINAAPLFDDQDIFLGYAGTTRDVTTEIQAEAARMLAEEHFNRLTRLSLDWYWQTDADGRITYVSESYTRMTGMSLNEVIGLVAFQPEPADGRGDERNRGEWVIAALVATRQPFYDKVYLRSQKVKPGQEEWRITSGEPVFDSDGIFLGYRGTARAVSAPTCPQGERQP